MCACIYFSQNTYQENNRTRKADEQRKATESYVCQPVRTSVCRLFFFPRYIVIQSKKKKKLLSFILFYSTDLQMLFKQKQDKEKQKK